MRYAISISRAQACQSEDIDMDSGQGAETFHCSKLYMLLGHKFMHTDSEFDSTNIGIRSH